MDADLNKLLIQARSGDTDAFSCLVRELTPRITAYFHRCLPASVDIEALTQEFWIRVSHGIRNYDSSQAGRATSWAFTIARNLRIDEQRHRARSPCIETADLDEMGQMEPDSLVDSELLASCLDELQSDQRTMIHLRFWEELDLREIGERMGIEYGPLKARFNRAVKSLLKSLRYKGL